MERALKGREVCDHLSLFFSSSFIFLGNFCSIVYAWDEKYVCCYICCVKIKSHSNAFVLWKEPESKEIAKK